MSTPDDEVGSTSEELLDLGWRRPVPSWAWPLMVLVLAGVVVVAIAHSGGLGGRPAALPTQPTHPTHSAPPPGPSPASPHPGLPGLRVTVSPESTQSAALSGGELFVYSGGRLSVAVVAHGGFAPDPAPLRFVRTVAVPGRRSVGSTPAPLVIEPDIAHHRVWLVQLDANATGTEILEYDSSALHPLGGFVWRGSATGAAVLDGRLYINTSTGLAMLDASASGFVRVPGVPGGMAIAADPSRHRLLLMYAGGDGAHVRSYTPGVGISRAAAIVRFGVGNLVVVDGRIWASGYSARGAALVRLDPHTLRPQQRSVLAPRLGAGAQLVAVGERDFFVRNGAGGEGLWCVDGTTGRQRARWQLPGVVASGDGLGYRLLVTGRVDALPLGSCRG
jgi:hypothetical protein